MKIKSVKIKKAKEQTEVVDMFEGDGFLLESKASMPDIDMDYASDGREKVKKYLEDRYNHDGTENVFSAGTLTTLKIKQVIKDVGLVHKVPYDLRNYITAMIKDDAMTFTGFFKECLKNKKLKKFAQDFPRVIEDIRSLMNQPRSTSIHASAIVVTPKFRNGKRVECFDYVPIRMMDGLLVSEFDGYSLEDLGLLKNDVLATKELMKLRNTIELINENYKDEITDILNRHGLQFPLTMEKIHTDMLDYQEAYNIFSNGYTQNIFQFSGPGMTKFVSELQPTEINDIIAANALYRPATIEIKDHEKYITYKRGEAQAVYNFGTYEHTGQTYGIMAYQEQYMKIAQTLGGFSLSKADVLRKAIGKKLADLMETLKSDFISGAIKNDCPKEEAEAIWKKIELAGKYSFNKSHSAAYGCTAYDGAWLKALFPTPFYTVALQFCKDDQIKELMGEMTEASRCRIVPPDVNVSGSEFYTNYKTDEIFWSLSRIKFVGAKAVIDIIKDRKEFGPFKSFKDFFIRMEAKALVRKELAKQSGERATNPVNSRVMKNMILTGCFDKVEEIKAVAERFFIIEQLFKLNGADAVPEDAFPPDMIGKHYFWSSEQIKASGLGAIDYRRIYNGSDFKKTVGKVSYLPFKDALLQESEGRRCVLVGTVLDVVEKAGVAKVSKKPYIFGKVTLQQNNEVMECSFWNATWEKKRPEIMGTKGKMMIVNGTLKYNDFINGNTLNTGSNVAIEVI